MKRRYRLVILASVLVLVMIAAVAVYSQSDLTPKRDQGRQGMKAGINAPGMRGMQEMRGMRRGGSGFRRLLADLNLSQNQKRQIAEIAKKFRYKTEPIRQELRTKNAALVDELTSKELNRRNVRRTVREINALREKLTLAGVDRLADIMDVMTPAQKQTINDRLHQWKERGGAIPGIGGMDTGPRMSPRRGIGGGMGSASCGGACSR